MKKSKAVKRIYKGRSALIHKLHASGNSKAEILEAVKLHYPDTTKKVITDVCAAKPIKPVKAAPVKAPAKSKTPPPPKRASEQIAEGRAKLVAA